MLNKIEPNFLAEDVSQVKILDKLLYILLLS